MQDITDSTYYHVLAENTSLKIRVMEIILARAQIT